MVLLTVVTYNKHNVKIIAMMINGAEYCHYYHDNDGNTNKDEKKL